MQKKSIARQEDAPTILYLGGLSSSMHGTKATMVAEWAQKRDLSMVRFDYRGHGESTGEFVDFGIDHWAQDALNVLDEVIEGKVILIGSSLGGWIGALLAKQRPKRIAGFIGIASAPDFTETSFRTRMSKEQIADLALGKIVELASGYPEPYQVGLPLMDGGRRSLVLDSKIDMPFPVRLLQGMNDRSVSVDIALKFARAIESDDLELQLVKHADHGFSRDQDMSIIYEKLEEILKNAA